MKAVDLHIFFLNQDRVHSSTNRVSDLFTLYLHPRLGKVENFLQRSYSLFISHNSFSLLD